ncbi:prophage protein [Shigella sonnei]|nr:prophage protein [Shigella sonnei]
MLSREDFYMIKQMRQQGAYIVDIATQIGCSERTVRRYLKYPEPPARKTPRHKMVNSTTPFGADTNSGSYNPYHKQLDIIVDPRLDEVSDKQWYMLSAQGTDTIEVAYLDGNDEPYLEQQEGFIVDGVAWKVRIDAGVAALDYRGMVRAISS